MLNLVFITTPVFSKANLRISTVLPTGIIKFSIVCYVPTKQSKPFQRVYCFIIILKSGRDILSKFACEYFKTRHLNLMQIFQQYDTVVCLKDKFTLFRCLCQLTCR